MLTTVAWIDPDGGDWDTPSNWSTGELPGVSDDVVIDLPGVTVTHSSPASDSVNSLTISSSDSALDISDGALALATSSSIGGSLTLGGATLSTAESLTVSGSMTWTGGTIAGPGSLDIADGATLRIDLDPGVAATLDGVALQNAGDASLALAAGCCGFALALADGAGVDNQATGTFSFPTDLPYATGAEITGDGSDTFFHNEGALIQPVGNIGQTYIETVFTQSDGGSTAVQAGAFEWDDGGSIGGSITAAAGTGLAFYGPAFSFDASSGVDSGGGVLLDAATVTVAGSYAVATSTAVGGTVTFSAPIADLGGDLNNAGTLVLPGQSFIFDTLEDSGTIDGADGLTVSGSMTWTGGTIAGPGSLDIADGATLRIDLDPGVAATLDGVALQNAGDASLALAAGCCGFALALADGAGVDNQATGTFSFPTDLPYATGAEITGDGSDTFFHNEGALIQPAGNIGQTLIDVPFSNSGSVVLQQGSLVLGGDGSTVSSGTFTAFAGTYLEIDDQILTADSVVASQGSVALSDCAVAGNYGAAGDTNARDTTFTGPVSLGSSLEASEVIFAPSAGGPVSLTAGSISIAGALGGTDSLVATGQLAIAGGSTLSVPAVDAYGAMSVDAINPIILDGTTLNNHGAATWEINGGPSFSILEAGAAFNNLPGGTLAVEGIAYGGIVAGDDSAVVFNNQGGLTSSVLSDNGFDIQVPLVNSGSVDAQHGALGLEYLINSGTIDIEGGASLGVVSDTQVAGSTVLDGGTIFGGSLGINGGSLGGTGTVDADVTASGQVMPGGAGDAGVLTIDGDYTQTAAGALVIDIGGTTVGTQYDQLDVSGSATIAGTLVLDLIDGFTPSLGQTFTIVDADPLNGAFSTINQSAITGGAFQPIGSSGSVALVAEESSTTTLTSSANPSAFGQSVTFTATVKATPPDSGTPSGTVTFYDGSTSLGTATLGGGGKATLKTAGLATGPHAITVVYAGSNTFATSASPTLMQVVDTAATVTSLTSSANPSVSGQSVKLTATISVVAPGGGRPTGSVLFYDGAGLLATVALSGRSATYKTGALSVGSHSITAVYSGDGDYAASTSTALTQAINQDATTTAVSSSKNPSVYGQAVTITAKVAAASPGGGTPTGTVTFMDGSSPIGTGSLSVLGGVDEATFTTSSLAVATHTITAVYGGDTNFTTSTSSVLSQTVKQATATTTLASSDNPSTFGQSVTLTATVAPAPPGAGTPTGTVTFYDGSNAIGTVALTGGVASFTISTLSVGIHSIKAVYGGDANFMTSTSVSLKQKVQAAPAIAGAGTTAFSKRLRGGVSSSPPKTPPGLLIDGVLATLQAETASATAIGDLAFDQVTGRDGGRAD